VTSYQYDGDERAWKWVPREGQQTRACFESVQTGGRGVGTHAGARAAPRRWRRLRRRRGGKCSTAAPRGAPRESRGAGLASSSRFIRSSNNIGLAEQVGTHGRGGPPPHRWAATAGARAKQQREDTHEEGAAGAWAASAAGRRERETTTSGGNAGGEARRRPDRARPLPSPSEPAGATARARRGRLSSRRRRRRGPPHAAGRPGKSRPWGPSRRWP